MLTREQVEGPQPGDTVELTFTQEYDATTITARGVFPAITNWYDNYLGGPYTLAVVSRAPRPLYVNHPRTEPVPGDVVRDADDDGITATTTWFSDGQEPTLWCALPGLAVWEREDMPDRLRLLVDGETGQVVP